MIAHFSYLLCQGPGSLDCPCVPGELFDTAAEARQWGRRAGWARIDGKDLCPGCWRLAQATTEETNADEH